MIGGDTDMGCPLLEQQDHRAEDTTGRSDLLARVGDVGGGGKEIPEELVGAVDQMNLHRAMLLCLIGCHNRVVQLDLWITNALTTVVKQQIPMSRSK